MVRPEEAPDLGCKRAGRGGLPRGGETHSSETINYIPLKTFSLPLALTGMQGSTPLDVAAASVIDNNELALALQEQDLEKVWKEEAWPLRGPLGHLLIWDPPYRMTQD